MVACRWLTLGSGNLTSHPSPRPITTIGASNVMEMAAAGALPVGFPPVPERMTTVTDIEAHYTRCRAHGHENGVGEKPGPGAAEPPSASKLGRYPGSFVRGR
jgi:hypothetical protein